MTTATLLPLPRFVAYDSNGAPLSGGYVYTYQPGTTTPVTTWQDAGETTPNLNPVLLDANGSCLLYGSGQYQIVTTDSNGNQIPQYSGLTMDTLSIAQAEINAITTELATYRVPLTGNLTWYVNNLTGNDANNGLSPTTAFKTIQGSVNVIQATYDGKGHAGTVSVATTGTNYNEGTGVVFNAPFVGFEGFTYTCDSTASSVVIQSTGPVLTVEYDAIVTFTGGFEFDTSSSAQNGLQCLYGGKCYISGLTFGPTPSAAQLYATRFGYIEIQGPTYINGGTSANLAQASHQGNIRVTGSTAIINFNAAHSYTDVVIYTLFGDITFTGGAGFSGTNPSGTTYRVAELGLLQWAADTGTGIPGSAIGSEELGGRYSYGSTPLEWAVGSFTVNMATIGSGTVNIGTGFIPGSVDFICCVSGITSQIAGIGWATMNSSGSSTQVATNFSMAGGTQGPSPNATVCLQYYVTSGNSVVAAATTVLFNGLTLTFTTTGSPTGTLTVYWRAKRGI